MGQKTVLVIEHEELAHLGSFRPVLEERGWNIVRVSADAIASAPRDVDLVIVLGGSMGVYESVEHPYLTSELAFLEERLNAERPTLGVCLGAQLMAAALGATVAPGKSVEIGFRMIRPTDAGTDSPLRHVAGIPMMQWHGDTFDIPAGAVRLASSAEYTNEAFGLGNYGLGLQFHPELTGDMYEEWITSGSGELGALGIEATDLRAQRDEHAAAMEQAARRLLGEWLDGL